MKRQFYGLITVGLAFGLGAGCVDDPTASLSGNIASIVSSLTFTQLDVGDSVRVTARAVDTQGNALPTRPQVSSSDESVLAVSVDQATSGKPLPETVFFIRAVGFGKSTVTAGEGGSSRTITVQTWPGVVAITSGADSLRAGSSDTYVAEARSTTGQPITGPTPVDYTWAASGAPNAIDPTGGNSTELTTTVKGVTVLTVSVNNGAAATKPVTVLPDVPVAAALEATSFGAVGSGGTSTLEVVLTDALGNVNNLTSDLSTVTATSSDPAVAAVEAEVVDVTLPTGAVERHFLVTATGVGGGVAEISGSVETVSGSLAFTAAPVTVLAPAISSITPPSTAPGETITIDGTGLTAPGFETLVLVNGFPAAIGNQTQTSITATVPIFGANGEFPVVVTVGGVPSNAATWTETGPFLEFTTEPTNDNPFAGPNIGFPISFSGGIDDLSGDTNDFFRFTLLEGATIDFVLDWDTANDVDIYVVDGAFTVFQCTDGGTLAQPEVSTCSLGPGEHILWITDFGPDPGTMYTVIGAVRGSSAAPMQPRRTITGRPNK